MAGRDDSLPFEALAGTAADGLFVLDGEGQVVWANAALAELAGLDGDDPTGRDLASLLGAEPERPDLDRFADGEDPTTVCIRTGPDAAVPCRVHVRELSGGRYVGWIREDAGREQPGREHDRYRVVLDAVEDGIYVTDEDRRFTWLNEAAERMYGFEREEAIGRHLFEFLDDDQVEAAKHHVEYLLAEETPDVITFEMEVTRKDGTTFPAETRSTLLPGDEFTGTVGIIRDVTERKERERELERQNERLQTFADTLSHDIRNPLSVALARLNMARRECDSEHLSALGEALDRMDDLVDQLYTLALHGQRVDDLESTDVADLARSAWRTVTTGAADLRIEGSPATDADPNRLQQALENLFRNAVEHAGPAVTVRVGELPAASGFYVEDDGPGIPAEERDEVFEAGYSTAADGTGFGLNIVREIADAHGWALAVREGSDGGARFEFRTDPGA